MGSQTLLPADERILEYLAEHPPDYVPLIANRLGMHLGFVERRRDVLVDLGFVEPVTNESIYGITERGERYLAGDLESGAVAARSDD